LKMTGGEMYQSGWNQRKQAEEVRSPSLKEELAYLTTSNYSGRLSGFGSKGKRKRNRKG